MQALGCYFETFNRDLQRRYGVDVSGWWPRRPGQPR